MIPEKYSGKGLNLSPPLTIRGVPEEAISLALIMHDLDASSGDFLHWAVWNINPDVQSLGEGQLPDHAFQGMNGYGKVAYAGPYPPSGTHRYSFDVYALDTELDLPEGANRGELEEALEDHIIAKATLTGVYSAE